MGMGGNFVSATPDTVVTEAAMRNATLTVHVSTKLNRSHVVAGRPRSSCRSSGAARRTARAARSRRSPSRTRCPRSTPRTARSSPPADAAVRGRHHLRAGARPGPGRRGHPVGRVRRRLRADPALDQPGSSGLRGLRREGHPSGGFVLPHPPRDSRTFETPSGKAVFSVSPTDTLHVPAGRLLLQTLRSHDQFNTTNLRARRPLPRHQERPPRRPAAPGRHRRPGPGRRSARRPRQRVGGRVGAHGAPLPRRRVRHPPRLRGGVLPGDQRPHPARPHRHRQQLPASKSVVVRVEPHPTEPEHTGTGHGDAVGSDEGHKSDVQPHHLS